MAAANGGEQVQNHLKSGWVSKTVPLEDNLSDSALQTEDSGLDDTKRAVLEAVNSLPENTAR